MNRILNFAIAALTIAFSGCGGSGSDTPMLMGSGVADVPPMNPQAACDALAGFKVAASSIDLPTGGAAIASATFVPATSKLAEHCRVNGSITSMDPSAASINFSAALPTAWNKKLMHFGGGGWNGIVADPTGIGGATSSGAPPLARGYAVFGSDSGHNDPTIVNASFALNDEQLKNFAADQLKKTRDVVMAIVFRRYGERPIKTYFQGGSEGGRESMAVIQRFPNDYDGVITLYPVFNWFSSFFKWQMVGRAMRLNNGAGYLSAAKIQTLRAAELAACDQLDGVKDGIISNVNACSFDPQTLLCAGGDDDKCLSQAQVATVRVLNSSATLPYSLANENRYIPKYYAGTEWLGGFGGAGLGNSPTYTNGFDLVGLGPVHLFGDSLVRFVIKQDPSAETLTFDPENPGGYLARVQEASRLLDMTDPDISAFIARGGKWIMTHGLSDELPMADGTETYYRRLVSKYGQSQLDGILRFYTIPGFGHAHGSFDATGGMPVLDALEAWVERGVPPADLVVTDMNPGANRTRPMCVFPRWPKYKGSGDINAAANYACATD